MSELSFTPGESRNESQCAQMATIAYLLHEAAADGKSPYVAAKSLYEACNALMLPEYQFARQREFLILIREMSDAGLLTERRGRINIDSVQNVDVCLSIWFEVTTQLLSRKIAMRMAAHFASGGKIKAED